MEGTDAGEAILKNSAGRVAATNYVSLSYDVSLGFESTEYDRLSLDTNSATRPEFITLDGYFEPVAQALINSSSPHLNIWGGGLDRPEFLDADYEFGIQSDLVIGRNVMFSGIVDDGLTVVSRPAYLVTVEVESLRPGAAPQRIMVTFTVSARDATPSRNDAYAYLADGASYEGVELQIPSSKLCPASANFGMVPLLVEPDVPLAGQVRYARPRYDSAMVDGEDARATIDFNLREYSESTVFFDSARRFAPAGEGRVAVSMQVHHESTYPGDAFLFYDGVSGPVAPVTVTFTSNRPGLPSEGACGLEPTYDAPLTLVLASGADVEILVFSSCPSARNPGWVADFYFVETGGGPTIARARAPYDLGSPRGNTTVVFAYPVVGGEKNFSVDPFGIPPGHDVFPASPALRFAPTLLSGFQDTVFAVQYDADDSNNILSVSFPLPYYNAVLSPLSIAYHRTPRSLVTDQALNLPSIDTPRPGRFRGAAFEVGAEPAEVSSPNSAYVWGKNAPPPSFRLADQYHGLRVSLSSSPSRDVPLIGDMFVFLDRGYDPRHFGGTLQTLPLGEPSDPDGGFKIEGYAALVSPLGASGNDDGARYAYAQRSEMFSRLFGTEALRGIYDFIRTGNCGRGSCAALFDSPEWAAVLSGVVGLQAVNVAFSETTPGWRNDVYFILPHDVVAIRAGSGAGQPVTLLAGSRLHPYSGRVIPALRFPAAGAIEIGPNGARGAIDGAYRQPLPVGGVHGSRFGFYKGELAPLDVVSPGQDCFARVVKIAGTRRAD